jgi:hypothetical protein
MRFVRLRDLTARSRFLDRTGTFVAYEFRTDPGRAAGVYEHMVIRAGCEWWRSTESSERLIRSESPATQRAPGSPDATAVDVEY